MEKVIERVKSWSYLKGLPETICGFSVEMLMEESDNKYLIFRYYNKELKRSFSVLYDEATKEFAARVTVGLTEFCDIRFIVGDLDSLEKVLSEKLHSTLAEMGNFNINTIECILREKDVVNWKYISRLPEKVGSFVLYIKPSEPVKVINGSYIIMDYSDFDSESNFIIYYNIFRDEFFGELKIRRTPFMTAEFDAKTLENLEEKLTEKLSVMLRKAEAKL